MLKVTFPRLPIRDKLLLYSHINELGCWVWQGTRFQNTGYGQITYKNKVMSTHRLAAHIFKGFNLKSKELVLHHCDNKACINPGHLYIGDRFDNARDAVERGQQHRGSNHTQAKLNETKILEIRQRLSNGESLNEIATHYAVSSSTIGLIRSHKIWTHVKGDISGNISRHKDIRKSKGSRSRSAGVR
jgi:ribosomal protein S13